jgi:acetyl-CoA synthetase
VNDGVTVSETPTTSPTTIVVGPIVNSGPGDILFSADLPKTRSGKIMRRLLKDIAEGRTLGDTTTLADPAVVNRLKEMYEDKEG